MTEENKKIYLARLVLNNAANSSYQTRNLFRVCIRRRLQDCPPVLKVHLMRLFPPNVKVSKDDLNIYFKVIAYALTAENDSESCGDLGTSMRMLRNRSADGIKKRIDKYLEQIVSSTTVNNLYANIECLLTHFRNENTPVNYCTLFYDIKNWGVSKSEERNKIVDRWIRNYFG